MKLNIALAEDEPEEEVEESTLPDVHYGDSHKQLNWRAKPDMIPDDDKPLSKTPDDVLRILGFDPLEPEEPDEDTDQSE